VPVLTTGLCSAPGAVQESAFQLTIRSNSAVTVITAFIWLIGQRKLTFTSPRSIIRRSNSLQRPGFDSEEAVWNPQTDTVPMDLDPLIEAALPDPDLRRLENEELPLFEYNNLKEDQIQVLNSTAGQRHGTNPLRTRISLAICGCFYLFGPVVLVGSRASRVRGYCCHSKLENDWQSCRCWGSPPIHKSQSYDILGALRRASSSPQRF
jgi:hypothetical protein